jgi:hypothetical protein
MKNLFIFFVLMTTLFSCQKEEDVVAVIVPKPPVFVRYNLADTSAVLINNTEVGRELVGFDGKYSIKYQYQYTLENGPIHQAFGYIFTQNDTGSVYFSGEEEKNYAVVLADPYFSNYHLSFKFDWGSDKLSISPEILTDTCQTFSITNKVTGREMRINSFAFIMQGFCVIFYDTPK